MALQREKYVKVGQGHLLEKFTFFCQVKFSKCCIVIILPDRLIILEGGKGKKNSLFKK